MKDEASGSRAHWKWRIAVADRTMRGYNAAGRGDYTQERHR
ncbi:MAG: hypothetical protein Q7R41_02500 [Phycisphaerales bacterium]|nr:hypothetical protein [Phycisphaerales bacterium]